MQSRVVQSLGAISPSPWVAPQLAQAPPLEVQAAAAWMTEAANSGYPAVEHLRRAVEQRRSNQAGHRHGQLRVMPIMLDCRAAVVGIFWIVPELWLDVWNGGSSKRPGPKFKVFIHLLTKARTSKTCATARGPNPSTPASC